MCCSNLHKILHLSLSECLVEYLSVCRILNEFLQRIPMFDERKNQKDLQVETVVIKSELFLTVCICS